MARARKTKGSTVKVNFKGVESRKNPAEGDYPMAVLEANSGQSGQGNDQIEFICEITAGEYKGFKGYLYCPLQENSLWKLHAFLTALGVEVPEDDMDIDLSDLIGKTFVGVITHETYNGKKRAKLTDFDSIENYSGDLAGDDEKSDKKKDKKSKKDKDDDGAKSGKDKKSEEEEKSSKKDKKPKKIAKADVEDMDEDELAALNKEHKLGVKFKDKLKKDRAAVIEALDAKDLLDD